MAAIFFHLNFNYIVSQNGHKIFGNIAEHSRKKFWTHVDLILEATHLSYSLWVFDVTQYHIKFENKIAWFKWSISQSICGPLVVHGTHFEKGCDNETLALNTICKPVYAGFSNLLEMGNWCLMEASDKLVKKKKNVTFTSVSWYRSWSQ